MKNFSKFCYGVRALSISTVCVAMAYQTLKETGAVDKVNANVQNIKNKIRNKKFNTLVKNMKVEEINENEIIKEEIKNTYYSECFKNKSN